MSELENTIKEQNELIKTYKGDNTFSIEEMEEEIKRLREKNKVLEERLMSYHMMMTKCDKANKFEFGCQIKKYNPELLDDQDHLPYHIKKMNEENKQLKEELRMSKKIIDSKESSWKTNKRLLQENEELKEKLNFIFPSTTEQKVIEKYQVSRTNHLREIRKLKEENKKVKEENEKLKEQLWSNYKDVCSSSDDEDEDDE